MEVVDYFSKEKPNLVMMIGLSGSGKSTASKTIYIDDVSKKTVILSSDALRTELFNDVNDQTHNEEVFNTLKQRAYKYCSEGKNVIIDATNLNVKDRAWIFNSWKKEVPVNRIACIIPTSLKECKVRNQARIRKIPEYVIDRQIRKFEIPFYEEGWDKICIWDVDDTLIRLTIDFNDAVEMKDLLFNAMKDFDQKNHHHKYTLDVHCQKVYEELAKRTDNLIILRAAMLHDTGKKITQEPRENNPNYSYFQHHNYGAYLCLSHWQLVGINNTTGIHSVDDLLECLFYINYHMIPFFINGEKSGRKYKKLWGEEKYNNLMMFNECDKIGTGTKEDT